MAAEGINMGRPKSSQRKIMKVPFEFDLEVGRLADKYNYKTKTDFLEFETLPLLKRVDLLSSLSTNMLNHKRKKNAKK